MELSIYDVIKRIVITEKTTDLFKKFGKLTLEVNVNTNKIMIRQAVEKVWDVKVKNVRIVTCPGKTKSFGRREFKSSDKKKAIVTLKEGYKIDLPGHFETMGVPADQVEKAPSAEGK